ncbi:MAG: hypothetical protein HPY73_01155 [Methanomassiliicoccales archaeon]|nr:MAG: hypothetical protein HPY73_01155 [Methanomassiliicoccales archaeon]
MKVDIRRLLGPLLGLAIIIEGGALAINASPAMVEGFGGLRESTVLMAGAQLIILGIIIFSGWFAIDLKNISSRPKVSKVLHLLFLVSSLCVMFEGLFLTVNATKVTFEEGETYGMVASALLSAQLFCIGALSSSLWVNRRKEVTNPISWVVGIASSIGLSSVGAILIGVASPLRTALIMNVGEGKMTLAGVLVFILSFILIFAFLLDGTKYFKGRTRTVFEVLFLAIVAVFMLGSTYLSALADYFELGNEFAAGKMYMGAFFAVIFMLSALSLAGWWTRNRTPGRRFIIESVGILSAILLAGIGIEVFALAGETKVTGLLTLPHAIVLLFGAQIVILSMICLGIFLTRKMKLFATPLVRSFTITLMLITASLISLEGIVISVAAADIDVAGLGKILESTVGIFGLGMSGAGILIILTWNMRDDHSSPRMRRAEILTAIFLLMLFVAALAI